MLGALEIERDGQILPPKVWRTRRAPLLLALLLWHAPRVVPRDTLLEALWPPDDATDPSGHALEVTVSRLRRALEPGLEIPSQSHLVLTHGSGYRVEPSAIWLDAAAFGRALDAGEQAQRGNDQAEAASQFREALTLVRGEYLAGEEASWIVAPREQYRQLQARALDGLVRASEALGQSADSVGAARAWLALDPFSESAARGLMRALYLAGEPAAALRAFEQLRLLLAEELGIDPHPETDALHGRILRGELTASVISALAPTPANRPTHPQAESDPALRLTGPAVASHPDTSVGRGVLPFVGREREVAEVATALDAALGGATPRLVLLPGEPGAGKTRLADRSLELAFRRWPAMESLSVRAFAPARDVPYAVVTALLEAILARHGAERVRGALGPWAPTLATLFPRIGPVPGGGASLGVDRAQIQAALADLLATLATERPLLVFLDDCQWADPSSLQVLFAVLRHAANTASHLAVLGTCRAEHLKTPNSLTEVVASLERDDLLRTVGVGPLSLAEVVGIARAAGASAGDGATHLASRLARASGGNAFYLVELLQAMRAATSAGSELDDGSQVPESVRSVIEQRIFAIDPAGRRLLAILAVLGRGVPLPLLARCLASGEEECVSQVEELMARHLLTLDGADIGFAHDLTREALLKGMLPPRRELLHRQVAEALESAGVGRVSAAELARHAFLGGDWLRAATWSAEAAAEAMRSHAADETLAHADRGLQALHAALPISALSPVGHAELLARRGEAREMLDRDGAAADYELALGIFRRAGERGGEVRILLALAGFHAGRSGYPQAQGLADEALRLTAEIGDRALEARTLNRLGNLQANAFELHDACGAHRRALAIARELGDLEQVAQSLDLLGMALAFNGDLPAAVEAAGEALELYRAQGDWSNEITVLINLKGGGCWFNGELEEGRRHIAEAIRLCREHRHIRGEAEALSQDAITCLDLGEYGIARAHAEQALALADRIGHREWQLQARSGLGEALVGLGWVDEGIRALRQACVDTVALGSGFWRAMTTLGLGRSLLALDRPAQALEALSPWAEGTGMPVMDAGLQATLALARLRDGQLLGAIDNAERAEVLARPYRLVQPIAALARAETLLALGDDAEGRLQLDRAISLARAAKIRPVLIPALRRRAHLSGDPSSANEDHRTARQIVLQLANSFSPADRAQFLAHSPLAAGMDISASPL